VVGGEFLEGVGKTALGVAMVRAGESRRSDRLFDDPHAAAFVAAAPHAFDDEQHVAGKTPTVSSAPTWGVTFAAHAVLRTRFFDDYVLDAAAGSNSRWLTDMKIAADFDADRFIGLSADTARMRG
jgi:O-methyltransferase involved in polyketide biosynthesis